MKIANLLFAISLTPLTASCVPPPPKVELCSFNWARDYFDCSKENVDRVLERRDADKYICRSARDEELRDNWIEELKKLAAKAR